MKSRTIYLMLAGLLVLMLTAAVPATIASAAAASAMWTRNRGRDPSLR